MLIATGDKDGRKLLILGLEQENINMLLNDMPIQKNMTVDGLVPELANWDIVILGPEDTVRFQARFNTP